MNEVIQKKNGDVILLCECGNIHNIHYNDELEDIELKTVYKKKEVIDEKTKTKNIDTKGTKDKKRNSVFDW